MQLLLYFKIHHRKMVSTDGFRKMALSFPDAVEMPHFDRASFRINNRIFATMPEHKQIAVLMLSPLQQSVFCTFDKTIIYPVPGGWGRQGSTIFELAKVKKNMLLDALHLAYCEKASKQKKQKT
jgi:hypothetical protein